MNPPQIDVRTIVKRLGGPKAIQKETGLSKGRVSQWCIENQITPAWRKYLEAKHRKAFTAPLTDAEIEAMGLKAESTV